MEIRRIGSYSISDAQGYLLNRSQPEANAAHWLSTFEPVRDVYLERWEGLIHSIYLRGSLAKGLAVDHVSDIDSFAVIKQGRYHELKELNDGTFDAWAEALEERLSKLFPFVAGLELGLESYESIFDREHIYGFTISVESICIYGDDLAPQLAPYQANHEIAFQTRYFQRHLEQFLSEFAAEPEVDKPAFVTWLMRRFLRLGMELVMEKEQRYSRDLYLCYESFARHYPEQAGQMYHALQLALNPDISDETTAYIKDFGSWLVSEAAESLIRWGYEPDETGLWCWAA